MRPKGKLFALFAVFAAIGLVTASGAFTTVTADRTAEVNVAGDGAALLALAPHSGVNGAYAETQDDQLTIVLDGSNVDAQGINENATTRIDNVFNISNQGTQAVDITVSASESTDNLNVGNKSSNPKVYFYKADNPDASLTDGASYNDVSVSDGNQSVGIFINSTNLNSDDNIDLTITINATSTTT